MTPAPLKRGATTDRDISPPPAKRKIITTTSNKAIANFFKPTSQKEADVVTFHSVRDTLLVARHGEPLSKAITTKPAKIAAFDFDDTLITTSSGNRFAKHQNDWKWWHASVPQRLKQLVQDGFVVVVLSNQGAISLRSDLKTLKGDMKSLNTFKGKVTSVLTALDLPISVYAATGKDLFRKPRTGMWQQVLADYGLIDTGDIVHSDCIFVGDAAGREGDKSKGIRKDHSCSDRDMAANVHIQFSTPEEFFLGHEPQEFKRTFIPAEHLVEPSPTSLPYEKRNDIDIVLFCGSPGAGKSTYFWRHLEPLGYARINQDILKTRERCVREARDRLRDGQSVVIDNTNADSDTRAVWIAIARDFKLPIRLVHFTSSAELCEHNATVRALSQGTMNPEKREILPNVAFTGFKSRYRAPQIEEGFQDITTVDFSFHGTDTQRELWKQYWIS